MSQDEEPVQLGSFFHVELWHEFMDAAGYADVDVLDHILSGMPIVGDITSSHRWASGRKPHPHSIEVDELRSRAWEFREKVLRAVRAAPVTEHSPIRSGFPRWRMFKKGGDRAFLRGGRRLSARGR